MSDEAEGRFSAIKSGLSRESIGSRLRAIGKSLRSISRATYLHYTILAIILALATLIRILPLRFGAFISEFDPYFAFNNMRQIVNNGWESWYNYVDTTAWFPFGRESVTTSYPGTSITGAMLYLFLQSLGVSLSLYDVAVFTPVLMGAFAVLVTYFFAKDLWGKSAGLFAGLFLAFNSSLLSRTSLGFFDNEEVGIPAMILTFLFFIRAVSPTRTLKATIIYSILSSLSLIWMAFSWGSFRYATEVLGLFALALVVLKRYSPRLMLAYGITQGFFLYTGTQIPQLGRIFLTDSTTLAMVGVMGVLVIMQLFRMTATTTGKLTVFGLSVAGVVAIVFFLVQGGLLTAPVGKFLTTINPFVRQNIPLVASVAENRPSTWASLFLELGSLTLLAVFGFFFAFQRLREGDVLLIIFGATAFYFAASLVRLTLILAPAISVLAAITVVELGKPAMDIIQQSVIFSRRKLRFQSRVSREFSLGILLIILVLVVPSFVNAVQSAYSPVTIAASSLPVRAFVPDWVETLSWMNNNLPSTSVVFAWWDYGYWISVNSGLHTLADNGTGNLTQIQSIATGFMLNESLAVHLMQRYGVTHVAVFVSYNRGLCGTGAGAPQFCGYGEDSKWYWMVRIANGTKFDTPLGPATINFREIRDNEGRTTEYRRQIIIGGKTDEKAITTNAGGTQLPASNTVLGLLMRDGFPGGLPGGTPDIDGHTPSFFTKAFSSTSSYVLVYSVKYPTATSLTVQLNPAVISSTGTTNITGILTTATGQPIETQTVPIVVEYTLDKGNTWNLIATANTTQTGEFAVPSSAWTPPAPPSDGSPILVRARWPGDPARLFDIAVSASVPLTKM